MGKGADPGLLEAMQRQGTATIGDFTPQVHHRDCLTFTMFVNALHVPSAAVTALHVLPSELYGSHGCRWHM